MEAAFAAILFVAYGIRHTPFSVAISQVVRSLSHYVVRLLGLTLSGGIRGRADSIRPSEKTPSRSDTVLNLTTHNSQLTTHNKKASISAGFQ